MAYKSRPTSVRSIFSGIIEAKTTEYGGCEMRSRLEADFARFLDMRGLVWTYEPHPFFASGKGYLPDFQIERPDGYHYIEVKPTLGEVPAAKAKLEIIWATAPKAVLIVACAETCRWFAREPGGEWTSWIDLWKHAETA